MKAGDHLSPTSLPRNVKLLGTASLLNDIASEMIFPLMPQFLIAEVMCAAAAVGLED